MDKKNLLLKQKPKLAETNYVPAEVGKNLKNVVEDKNMNKKVKLLIIEDEPTLREFFAIRLKEQKYEVETASDGNSALKKCKEFQPNILLLDVNLPDILGIDIVEKIKAAPSEYGTPKIIVITGISYSINDAENLWIKEFGVEAFFTKPFDLSEVIEKIESFTF